LDFGTYFCAIVAGNVLIFHAGRAAGVSSGYSYTLDLFLNKKWSKILADYDA
jgi:hypothetical protein